MRLQYILQTSFNKELERQVVYEILLPEPSDQGFYRTIGSLNAFFHSRKARMNVTVDRQFTRHASYDELSHCLVSEIRMISLPTLHAFFDYVGFDNKTKKYASGERIKKWSDTQRQYV